MTAPAPAAVLWDMDGTLVDTEPNWLVAQSALVREWGGEWDPANSQLLIGQGLHHSARILRAHGVELPEDEIIERLTTSVLEQIEHELPWRPGARELLLALREEHVPTALVTMSIGRMARRIASATGFDAFDVIVAGDEVEHAKPHPEPYLRAAELLDVDPAECVAFEDSAPGLASAVAAGTIAVGIPHLMPLTDDAGYEIWPTLAGRTVEDVRALTARRVP